ncbi:hypothetical protein BKA82DRAFT_306865 [Pisolithus tinctorius]|uniref:XLF-like N-terminal domain-containing protein n=1 Tax=Pisolithus tinctorius Marx 270 TaxID=870435 RepID=A0A0C3JJ33_PISTI|nr:hypothetical protein BKA82DRAFT_306865 [Pisolithus tinctorius]KIO09118.1 hypothetical protein M404DRAFT_306865 [Pisolithus tinctorius Marx 270]
MEYFSEEHSKLLLSKEWLVKVDAQTAKPYLFKFHSSSVDLTCCFMITDTKCIWAEVLNSKQFARRWRECNRRISSPLLDDDAEEAWRTRNLDLLSRAHTLGGVSDVSFEPVESKIADLAFELECDTFKWRWDTIFVGHKASADILSQHLIMPLISVNHLAFSSPNAVGDFSGDELEKAIDKIGRTARRTVDTHIKNAMSKPRLATTLRRMTAVFNFISDLPKVTIANDVTPLQPREPAPKLSTGTKLSKSTGSYVTDKTTDIRGDLKSEAITLGVQSPITADVDMGSATESESDSHPHASMSRESANKRPVTESQHGTTAAKFPVPSKAPSPAPSGPQSRNAIKPPPVSSDTDSSPIRPAKKSRPSPASDEDSEEERKKLAAQIKSGATSVRGTRQPLRRGGRKF